MRVFIQNRLSSRKLLLYMSAWYRNCHKFPTWGAEARLAADAAEQSVDGPLTSPILSRINAPAYFVKTIPMLEGPHFKRDHTLFADILRDIVGNPFRSVIADPSWFTSTVLALAQDIYLARAFDRLPILADALQDAGCDSSDILDHLRGPGPHVKGCWVVDLLLVGKV